MNDSTKADPREGGWTRYFNRVGRGRRVRLAKCEPLPPAARRFYEAWKKSVSGSIRWGVVEVTAERAFVRTMQERDFTITRQSIPLTEDRARTIATRLNDNETARLACLGDSK